MSKDTQRETVLKKTKEHLLFLQKMFGSQDPHLVSYNQGELAHCVADAKEMRYYASLPH